MNKLSQPGLWEKIKNFNLDDPYSSFPFSKKLSQQNNWSLSFTNKAIAEYRKFIYLCCISPTGASPSETIDEVWHLHLTYTDNYWNKFCKETLNKEIHHYPSKGGVTESEKHVNWYAATLELYESIFEMKPPQDIWPAEPQTVTPIDEPVYEVSFLQRVIIGFATVTFFFVIAINLFHSKGKDFLAYYALIAIAGLIVLLVIQLHKDKRLHAIVQQNLPKQFSVFQISRFLYGAHRAYQVALVDLLKRGIIETSGNDYKVISYQRHRDDSEENPLLVALLQQVEEGEVFVYNKGLGYIDTAMVTHPGLERLNQLAVKVDYVKLIIPGIVLFIGIARFLQGVANSKPVGFLLLEMIVFGGLCLMILQSFSYLRTVKKHIADFWKEQNAGGDDVINDFSINGTSALQGFAEYAALASVFVVMTPEEKKWGQPGSSGCGSTGSCSSGSSCGSSCGGGCGGCGS